MAVGLHKHTVQESVNASLGQGGCQFVNTAGTITPVSEHLSKAIVYYVKAKLAKDAGQIDLKEYNIKEFYRLAHKSKTSREYGPTMVIPGSHTIR